MLFQENSQGPAASSGAVRKQAENPSEDFVESKADIKVEELRPRTLSRQRQDRRRSSSVPHQPVQVASEEDWKMENEVSFVFEMDKSIM